MNSEKTSPVLSQAMDTLNTVVRDGLAHGFFKCCVSVEMINGGKRRFIIEAGKSHSFIIAEDALQN